VEAFQPRGGRARACFDLRRHAGKIVRLLVAVGDEVVAGQGIVVVEAMKMQNELKAPRDGRVTSIEVRENDSVNAGTVLATIE
jgi:biotin carboxyl carrier protein